MRLHCWLAVTATAAPERSRISVKQWDRVRMLHTHAFSHVSQYGAVHCCMIAIDDVSSVKHANPAAFLTFLVKNNVVDKSAFFSATCDCVPDKLISLLQRRHSDNLLSGAGSNRVTGTAPGHLQWDGSHHHKQRRQGLQQTHVPTQSCRADRQSYLPQSG